MVDTTEFTPEEEERSIQAQAAGDAADASGAAAATDEQASSEVEASTADETSSDDAIFRKRMSTSGSLAKGSIKSWLASDFSRTLKLHCVQFLRVMFL